MDGGYKELAAGAAHRLSGRRGKFQAINCAAIPRDLMESTLFGHQRGAFTGADRDAAGILRECDRGTIFLDEIGELPMEMQPKLLRFLQDGLVQPAGSGREVAVDVRVLAATNADLVQRERTGGFRADLLARVEGFVIEMPLLQDRREDIPILIDGFVRGEGHDGVCLSTDAAEALLAARWEHNVRGLRMLILKLAQTRTRDGPLMIELGHLPDDLSRTLLQRKRAPDPPELPVATRPTRDELIAALARADGNVRKVAEEFGKDRKQVYRWMEYLGLREATTSDR